MGRRIDMGGLDAVCASRLAFDGIGFGRRRLQIGDAIVGPGSSPGADGCASPRSFHRPVRSFSTTPRSPSCRNRSPVADRLDPAALASAITERPGLSRLASRSFRSAVFAEKVDLRWRALAGRRVGGVTGG
jgi:hypothetical protein